MFKKNLIVFLFCIIMVSSATAENADVVMNRAIGTMERWRQEVKVISEEVDGENVGSICNMAQTALALVESISLFYSDSNPLAAEEMGDIVQQDGGVIQIGNDQLLQTNVFWLDAFQSYASCDVMYRDDYIYATNSMYDENGIHIGTEYIEIGRRDEQIILLIVRYDGYLGATTRCAMKVESGQAKIIERMTLGKHMDIVLDVNAWQKEEIVFEEWSGKLLAPASVLLQ